MLNATRIRLYPTNEQEKSLAVQFGCARWVWNNTLAETQRLYKETGRGLNYHAMAIRLPTLKKEFEWLKDADSQALQQSLQNLARAFDNFLAKRGGYPRFKSKHHRQSFQYPQRVKVADSSLYLPKVGHISAVIHRKIVGRIKTVTISRNSCGQFYASILTDDGMPMPSISVDGDAIGVDVGLTHLVVTSNGYKFDNPRHIRKAERNLKRKQRKLSRKKKGSKSRERARKLVARAHERVACARKDYIHKLSRRIINENQVICVETLNVKGMLKNHNLARAVSDAGFGRLINFLEYKACREGKAFIKCDRWFPSSKTCSCCGSVQEKMPLSIRSWRCEGCFETHDRDVNAAINIRDEGLRILAAGHVATAAGGDVRPKLRRNSKSKAAAGERRIQRSLVREVVTCIDGSRHPH